jgi:acyl carrier protein
VENNRPRLDSAYAEPENRIEAAIADIWTDLLGVYPIGIHDNFFELGGDSLLAAHAIARIWDKLQVETDFESLFQWPTVAELAASVTGARVRPDAAMRFQGGTAGA